MHIPYNNSSLDVPAVRDGNGLLVAFVVALRFPDFSLLHCRFDVGHRSPWFRIFAGVCKTADLVDDVVENRRPISVNVMTCPVYRLQKNRLVELIKKIVLSRLNFSYYYYFLIGSYTEQYVLLT